MFFAPNGSYAVWRFVHIAIKLVKSYRKVGKYGYKKREFGNSLWNNKHFAG